MMSAAIPSENHYIYSKAADVPFEQIEYLGQGGQGTVDIVRRTSAPSYNETFARKCFIFSETPRKGDISAILREVSIATQLRHDHIVRLIQTYETPRVYAIIMTPVAEGNLQQYFSSIDEGTGHRRERLSRWFGCLVNAMDYLHKEGIHHRDIKPQNILTMGENILFTDFGISKEFQEKTLSGKTETLGTRTYRSPELHSGRRPGRRADIFSLGAVFLEMLIVCSGPGELERFKRERNGPYCLNMDIVLKWMDILSGRFRDISWFSTILYLCWNMLQLDQNLRPYADSLRICWLYQPFSAVPPTLASCKCCLLPDNSDIYSFAGVKEAFHKAAGDGNLLVVDLLIKNGADVAASDNNGRTPLSWAARNGHEAVVRLLVAMGGVDVNSKDSKGQTPLSWAARNGHEAVVRLLVAMGGVDVNSKDSEGQRALPWAARNRHGTAGGIKQPGRGASGFPTVSSATPGL